MTTLLNIGWLLIISVFMGVMTTALLFVFIEWITNRHKWVYRNPYDRTCSICKRNEQVECWGDDFAARGMRARGTWVEYNPGDISKHKK